MARVTVEDCLVKIPNRFELTLVSSKRARQLLLTDTKPFVPVENDKPTVLALREIADGYVGMSILDSTSTKPETQTLESVPAEIIAETQTVAAENPATETAQDVDTE